MRYGLLAVKYIGRGSRGMWRKQPDTDKLYHIRFVLSTPCYGQELISTHIFSGDRHRLYSRDESFLWSADVLFFSKIFWNNMCQTRSKQLENEGIRHCRGVFSFFISEHLHLWYR